MNRITLIRSYKPSSFVPPRSPINQSPPATLQPHRSRSISLQRHTFTTSTTPSPSTSQRQFIPKPSHQSPASPSAASKEQYPYPVYLIPTANTNEYAITFLPEQDLSTKPESSQRTCIIGWTRLDSPPTESSELFLDPKSFIQNDSFEQFLHSIIAKSITQDPTTQILAHEQKTGWLNVPDARCYVPWGRIPEVEDILGSVQLRSDGSGVMVPDSYQRNTMHRLVSLNGLVRLPEVVHKALVEALKAL